MVVGILHVLKTKRRPKITHISSSSRLRRPNMSRWLENKMKEKKISWSQIRQEKLKQMENEH